MYDVVQIISENLAMDQFMPPAQKSALNAAKYWMAQEWPRYFGLKALTREGFLAPAVFLSGSNNNTTNPMHRREKHGRRPCCAVLCCAVLCRAVPCCVVPCRAVPCRAVPCCAVLCRAVPCRAVPCCAVLCRAVLPNPASAALCCAMLHLSNSCHNCCKARCRCKCHHSAA